MVTFPWPWPRPTRTRIVQRGPATIIAEPNGSLTVQIATSEKVFEFQSCRLVFDGQTSTNVGVSWNLPDAVNMIVGKTIVLSTEDSGVAPTEAHIASGVPNDVRDFSKENTEALAERRRALLAWQSNKKIMPARREATPGEMFDELQKAQLQFVDLLELVGQGKISHVDGLLRLRQLHSRFSPCSMRHKSTSAHFVCSVSNKSEHTKGTPPPSTSTLLRPVFKSPRSRNGTLSKRLAVSTQDMKKGILALA
jgi:hypothetical protein